MKNVGGMKKAGLMLLILMLCVSVQAVTITTAPEADLDLLSDAPIFIGTADSFTFAPRTTGSLAQTVTIGAESIALETVNLTYENNNTTDDATLPMHIFEVADSYADSISVPETTLLTETFVTPNVGNTNTLLTITLDTPLALAANTSYAVYFDVSDSSANANFEWFRSTSNTGGDIYAGGAFYQDDNIKTGGERDGSLALTGGAFGPQNPDVLQAPNGMVIDAVFTWEAMADTEGVSLVDPNLVRQDVYLSDNQQVSGDPNLFYIGSDTTVDFADPNSQYPEIGAYNLDYDGSYLWAVVSIMDSGDQSLPALTDRLVDVADPNHVIGPVWNFNSLASVPVVDDNYPEMLVRSTTDINAVFEVPFASISMPTTTAWYQQGNAAAIVTQSGVGTTVTGDYTVTVTDLGGGQYTTTLEIVNLENADEGIYYCVITNTGGSDDSLDGDGRLGIKRQVAHWTLDAVDGYVDQSGEGHDADPNGVPVYVTGVVDGIAPLAEDVANGAVAPVDPNDGYAKAGTWDPSEFTDQLTASAWVKWDGTAAQAGIVCKRDSFGGAPNRWALRVADDGLVQFVTLTGLTAASVTPLSPGEWTFVTATFDGETGTVYIDGEFQADDTGSLGTGVDATVGIGVVNAVTGNPYAFNGSLDDVQIYNYAMTQEEIIDNLYFPETGEGVCIDLALRDSDLNLDATGTSSCRIDLADFVVFASNWLECGLYPAISCN